jgi:hypothetical protein
MFSSCLLLALLLPPCSPMFLLASYIFDYLRTIVDLVWVCFSSFHNHFSWVFNYLSISKNPQKTKFLKKFQKILIKFLRLKWAREAPGTTQGDPPSHHTTWWHGPGQAALWHGVGPPGPPLILPPATPFSLPKKHHSIAQTCVLTILSRDFRYPCSAHLCCWDSEHLFSGMWLLRLSK